MRLVFISDTHCQHKGLAIPLGDVLIHCGDATSSGTSGEVEAFLKWFAAQPHSRKILIAGNHDWLFQEGPDLVAMMLVEHPGITYLQDSGVEIDGLHFWGSPWQPEFNGWAFNLPRNGERLRQVWNRIPMETDVLLTHGPAHEILDNVRGGYPLGCEDLKIRLAAVRPRIHAFGHIHDSYGVAQVGPTLHLNASTCDETYRPVNRPIVVAITATTLKVLNTEPSPIKEALAAVRLALDVPQEPQAGQIQMALEAMAEIRGIQVEHLVQDYLRRGILSDLVKLERAEDRHSRRLVPVISPKD